MSATILVVEDDTALREALCDTLSVAGFIVLPASHAEEALSLLSEHDVNLVVSDVQMAPIDGHELLRRVKNIKPWLRVVLITAYGTVQKAVEAMRDGAADYLVKPFDANSLVSLVKRLTSETVAPASDVIATDAKTRELMALARRVAATETTVMIGGESGVGKEVMARYIHSSSKRAAGPFIAINCAAIPENMLEAVLFGYEKGAFTGAYQATPGKFEQAQGGTLLLDEVSEMDLGLQAKLLRVLQEREVERIGARKTIALDVRVLATSNRNLKDYVAQGKFREDLYYRLNVFPITLRPLRERPADIVPLALHLVQRRWEAAGSAPELTMEAQALLLEHAWPGNVRELDNVIQRALILCAERRITADCIRFEHVGDLPAALMTTPIGEQQNAPKLGDDLRLAEQRLILDALKSGNGSRKAAAEKLGISPRTLRYKLARLRDEGVLLPS